MEIYIVRHGETYWNDKHLLQGSVDIEINENGRKSAIEAGNRLEEAGIKFDKIYSSPLLRAYETACIIRGRNNIQIVRDDRLREMNFGINEGQDSYEMEADENNPFRYFFKQPEKYYAPKNGETFEELCERTKSFMEEVIEPQVSKLERIMIVGHGAMNKSIMCHVLKHGIDEFWSGGLQRNCSSIIVKLDENGYSLVGEN